MKPNNENNFLIEVTPEVAEELRQLFMHSDEEPYVLHFSPYWKSAQIQRTKLKQLFSQTKEEDTE